MIRVVFTDYDHALVYECFHANSSGKCFRDHVHIEFLSRKPEPFADDLQQPLLKRVTDLCVVPEAVEDVPHEGNAFSAGTNAYFGNP